MLVIIIIIIITTIWKKIHCSLEQFLWSLENKIL